MKEESKTIINNLDELAFFVESLLATLIIKREAKKTATVIALSGDLGAGKTTLVQNLAKQLGIIENVTSPTFTIMKTYTLPNDQNFSHLVHMDAYRMDTVEELRPLRFEEILTKESNLVCIEWAEKIKEILPADTLFLDIKITTGEMREITVIKGE